MTGEKPVFTGKLVLWKCSNPNCPKWGGAVQRHDLHSGDEVRLGSTLLYFELEQDEGRTVYAMPSLSTTWTVRPTRTTRTDARSSPYLSSLRMHPRNV